MARILDIGPRRVARATRRSGWLMRCLDSRRPVVDYLEEAPAQPPGPVFLSNGAWSGPGLKTSMPVVSGRWGRSPVAVAADVLPVRRAAVGFAGQHGGAALGRAGDGLLAGGQLRELRVERRAFRTDPRHPVEVTQRRRARGGPLQRVAVPPRVVHRDQYANAFNRGNDTSGAPIWIGTTKFANANTIGVAKNNNMIVPCIVNNWLYCSGDRNCIPGRANSARISSAINPPSMKNTNDVTKYMIPICFASVVRRTQAIAQPLTCRRTGYGRAATGRGASVVMRTPRMSHTETAAYLLYRLLTAGTASFPSIARWPPRRPGVR